jgi:hypothetical protein
MADNSSPGWLWPFEAGTQLHPFLEVTMRAMVRRGPNRVRGEEKDRPVIVLGPRVLARAAGVALARRIMGRRTST